MRRRARLGAGARGSHVHHIDMDAAFHQLRERARSSQLSSPCTSIDRARRGFALSRAAAVTATGSSLHFFLRRSFVPHLARVRWIGWGAQEIKQHPTEVDCFVQIVEGDEKLLHLSTFGSDARASKSTSSQSLQLNREQAERLRSIIDEVFPANSNPT